MEYELQYKKSKAWNDEEESDEEDEEDEEEEQEIKKHKEKKVNCHLIDLVAPFAADREDLSSLRGVFFFVELFLKYKLFKLFIVF